MNSKSQKILKNSLLMAAILLTCGMAHAQSGSTDSTRRDIYHGGPRGNGDSTWRSHPGHRAFHPGSTGSFRNGGGTGVRGGWQASAGRGHRGHDRQGIHYTPEQRRQLMAINKEYRDRSTELFKKDNITLKEYKAGLLALQKDKRSKMSALLTPEQKDQQARRKKMMEENRQVAEAARMERLKLRLSLSDDQVAKIKAGQSDLRTQAKAIHENDNLLPRQKMEQMKGLMAKRKDVFKSVLTPEQFSKFEEMSRRRGFGHDGPGGRPGWDRGRRAMENDGPDGGKATAI